MHQVPQLDVVHGSFLLILEFVTVDVVGDALADELRVLLRGHVELDQHAVQRFLVVGVRCVHESS